MRPVIVVGSAQAHAYIGDIEKHCPCLTSAMGMGGGQIPMIVYAYENP